MAGTLKFAHGSLVSVTAQLRRTAQAQGRAPVKRRTLKGALLG